MDLPNQASQNGKASVASPAAHASAAQAAATPVPDVPPSVASAPAAAPEAEAEKRRKREERFGPVEKPPVKATTPTGPKSTAGGAKPSVVDDAEAVRFFFFRVPVFYSECLRRCRESYEIHNGSGRAKWKLRRVQREQLSLPRCWTRQRKRRSVNEPRDLAVLLQVALYIVYATTTANLLDVQAEKKVKTDA